MTVFDGHSDLLYDVTRRRLLGETHVLERCHLENLRKGGVEGLVLALWVSQTKNSFWSHVRGGETDAGRTQMMLRCMKEELAECPELVLVCTGKEAMEARRAGKLYAFLGVEGMASIERESVAGIDGYADLGARVGMLTWNEENDLATGAGGDPHKGLTMYGKQAVRRMQERKMLVDVSHLNDGGFWDVMDLTDGPVIASHSNCRAICDVRRNLSDEQLQAIRDIGGVVGLNVHHGFVHAEPQQQTVEMLAHHAAHMAEVMGVEHVACGFDFCEFFEGTGNEGVQGMENAACAKNLMLELEKLGMNSRERELIARENFLRLLG